MNARECVDWVWGRWVYVPWARPARGRTVAQGSPAAQGSPVAHKSHGAVRLSVQNTLREKRLALARRLGKSPGPLMAARRCDGRHIKQALSPIKGEAIWVGEQVGGSGTLGSVRLGARSPMLWPKYLDDIEG